MAPYAIRLWTSVYADTIRAEGDYMTNLSQIVEQLNNLDKAIGSGTQSGYWRTRSIRCTLRSTCKASQIVRRWEGTDSRGPKSAMGEGKKRKAECCRYAQEANVVCRCAEENRCRTTSEVGES